MPKKHAACGCCIQLRLRTAMWQQLIQRSRE
jgi:hypothetical protein